MLNFISLLIGVFGLGSVAFAFLPGLGWMNWGIIPVAILGLGIGVVSKRKSGANLNVAVILIAVLRLMLGGGIF